MSRTGEKENSQANQQLQQQQAESYRRANEATDRYNAKVSEIEAAGNPYDYNSPTGAANLKNWNTLVGSAASAETKAAQDEIEQTAKRTGLNSAATPYVTAELGRQKARDMSTARASQAQSDLASKIAWDQWLTNAKLGAAGVDTSIYGTSTSGRSAALKNLADLGIASYGPIQSAIGAAGTVLGGVMQNPNLFKGSKG